MRKFKVVTLCGSTRFKEEFIEAQKKLTLKGFIVISVGLFGHSGDDEVWDGMDEGKCSETKAMLDDMHKEKIDMADSIYVINPGGYIGSSTWSEICYAYMTGKKIESMEPISETVIKFKVRLHIAKAEELAFRQLDVYSHLQSDYPDDSYLLDNMVRIDKGKRIIIDPWFPEDSDVPTDNGRFGCHANPDCGYDPFKIYGKKDMAKFVEQICMKEQQEKEKYKKPEQEELLQEVKWYIDELKEAGIDIQPENYPNMTVDEMKKFIYTWSDFNPYPDLD